MAQTVIPILPLQPRFKPDHPVKRGINTLLDLFFGATEEEQANEAVLSMMGPLALAKGPAKGAAKVARALTKQEQRDKVLIKLGLKDPFLDVPVDTVQRRRNLLSDLFMKSDVEDQIPRRVLPRGGGLLPASAPRRTSLYPTGGDMIEGLTPQQINWVKQRLASVNPEFNSMERLRYMGPNWEKLLTDRHYKGRWRSSDPSTKNIFDDVVEKIYQFRAANRGVKTP